MTTLISRLTGPAAAAGQAALALYVWKFGSTAPIPMQLGLNGQVDRWGDRTEAALFIGGMAGVGLLAGWALDWSAARPGTDEARRKGLAVARTIVVAVPCIVSAMMAGLALSAHPSEAGGQQIVLTAVCALLAIIGSLLGKVAPNALVGVRTPWSLNSKLAWEKSNRLAGRLFFWGGLIGALLAPSAPQPIGMQVFIVGMLLITVLIVMESWRVWRSDPERRVV